MDIMYTTSAQKMRRVAGAMSRLSRNWAAVRAAGGYEQVAAGKAAAYAFFKTNVRATIYRSPCRSIR